MFLKPGKYKATSRGFIHDRICDEGEAVVLSEDFITRNPKFTASWLVLIESFAAIVNVENDEQVEREKKEAALRNKLESFGVDVDGRWGLKKLQDELVIAEERSALEDSET